MRSYFFSFILMTSLVLGSLVGYFFNQDAMLLKPFGDIFINLILTAIVPLIFFSVSSAIARATTLGNLGRTIFYMGVVFILTGIIASIFAIFIVKIFPPAKGLYFQFDMQQKIAINFSDQLIKIFTVSDFSKLFSHQNILALLFFSILVGLSVPTKTANGQDFVTFLKTGETIFMRVFSLIMYYAPIGFFSYFAVTVSELGPKIMTHYVRIALIYYLFAMFYFLFAFTLYAYLAGKFEGIKLFWRNIFLPMTTSLATCSSVACIPANLAATKEMRVASEIRETVIPLGSVIHKEGSIIGGTIKIAFLFGIFHLKFSGLFILLSALGVSLLVGTVMGAIPGGGMIGELLILSFYGFPPSALMSIGAISIIIDPLATMLNVTGNSVSSMMIARLVHGKEWLLKQS